MHIKYKQDNLHRMTWYTSMCSIMAIGLLYMLALWSNVCVIWVLDPMVVRGWRSLNGRSLQDGRGPPKVGLSRATSDMYGSVQWLGHQHCTKGPLG